MWKCLVLLSSALAVASPVSAQNSDRALGEALLGTRLSGPPAPPRQRCKEGDSQAQGGEIVVCGSDGDGQRIPSTGDSDPTSRAGLRNGELHAPQLDKGSCRGKLGCFIGGGFGVPLYIIDMKAIPEAPEGSDADKIAKGQMAQP